MNLSPLRNWALPVLIICSFLSCTRNATKPSIEPPGAACKYGQGVTDIDGNTYVSVIIGTQEWMISNLTVTRYSNGDPIGNVTDASNWINLTTGGWCYYNNDVSNNATYGKLYNWYAVNDSRGVAPAGWHVPSESEWMTLVNYLGGTTASGGLLKESGPSHWLYDDTTSTNSTCFTALPGGDRNNDPDALFGNMTRYGCWWLSNDAQSAGADWISLSFNTPEAEPAGTAPKNEGFSIRCIKN